MKSYLKRSIVAFLLIVPFWSTAQVNVDGIDINKLEFVKFIELVAQQRLFSNKVVIRIDYGQLTRGGEIQRIIGKDGKNKKFNSPIDALNFMYINGWDYLESYIEINGNTSRLHYLLVRRPTDMEDDLGNGQNQDDGNQ